MRFPRIPTPGYSVALKDAVVAEFTIDELPENLAHFGFIAGYQKTTVRPEDPVNIEAAEKMARLHDQLKEIGYEGHALEVILVRLLFCLFAEFAYVNGKLFEEALPIASFDSDMRKALLSATDLNWGDISPAIFGSLFQGVMDGESRQIHRRNLHIGDRRGDTPGFHKRFHPIAGYLRGRR